MKIGILTYHCVPNFGAQLQAISTVGFFKRMGYDPIVLHWYPSDLEQMYDKRIPQIQIDEHSTFTSEVLPISHLCRTEKELVNEIKRCKIEAVFVGSDALFKYVPQSNRRVFSKKKLRYIYYKIISVEELNNNPFFGGFLSKLPQSISAYAFSVSSQNCPFFAMNANERMLMKQCMGNYKSITVRDEWTKRMVEEITGKNNIAITPDPVFSFNQNCYLKLPTKDEIFQKYKLKQDYILISFSKYYMNDLYIHKLSEEIVKMGFLPLILPMPEGCIDFGLKNKIELPLSPLEWYALIKYAKGYIGERMHPIVVALHNSVPFFCFDEYGTVERKYWGLKQKYIKQSSKTFLILERAHLLNFLFSYKEKKKFPEPSEVVNKILNFPVLKCTQFANEYQEVYEKNMMNIINQIESLR